jgi:hypothetical protein
MKGMGEYAANSVSMHAQPFANFDRPAGERWRSYDHCAPISIRNFQDSTAALLLS